MWGKRHGCKVCTRLPRLVSIRTVLPVTLSLYPMLTYVPSAKQEEPPRQERMSGQSCRTQGVSFYGHGLKLFACDIERAQFSVNQSDLSSCNIKDT
jgi:hypothetical protein